MKQLKLRTCIKSNQIKVVLSVIAILMSGCTDIQPSEQLVDFTAKIWNFFFSIGWLTIAFSLININKKRKTSDRKLIFMAGTIILSATYAAYFLFEKLYAYPLVLKLPFIN